ncbi:MAG TPA: uracil-DNA glycosylase family protein [Candidatus Saccharimonadaceae bacterium]|nr:uracil-DNA glycosylase family protein [Candidatus Saccharimonadaceae bacterium]
MEEFEIIRQAIVADEMNQEMAAKDYVPVYVAHPRARIVIASQAPGVKAQASRVPWDDMSGRLLRQWLDVTDEEFYTPEKFAIIPMDFYYPGKGAHGDLPPRKGFAEKWHPRLLELMPDVQLTILIGNYAQKYYLGKTIHKNLTETVRGHAVYLPRYFPLVHPSPLTLGWRKRNSWFEAETLPELRALVRQILDGV